MIVAAPRFLAGIMGGETGLVVPPFAPTADLLGLRKTIPRIVIVMISVTAMISIAGVAALARLCGASTNGNLSAVGRPSAAATTLRWESLPSNGLVNCSTGTMVIAARLFWG